MFSLWRGSCFGAKLSRLGITAPTPSPGCSFVIFRPHGCIITLQEDSDQGPEERQRASSPVRHSADSRWWRVVLTRGGARGHPRTWVRAPAGVTSGHHLRLPLTVTAVPPRGIVGDRARCQLLLYSPEKSGRVTFDLRCHLLMKVSGRGELGYNPHVTCSYETVPHVKQIKGRGGHKSLQGSDSPPPLLLKLLSVSCCDQPGLARWRYDKMRQLLCRNGTSWLHSSRCVGCQPWNL